MARRTKDESEVTRQEILDAAVWCFSHYGTSGTSLSKIAARTGRSRGAIYWHFREPADLLKAVLERGRLPILEQLEDACSSKSNVIGAMRECLSANFGLIQSDQNVRGALTIQAFRCDFSGELEQVLDDQRDFVARLLELLGQLLTAAKAKGELERDTPAAMVAAAIAYSVLGAMRVHLLHSSEAALVANGMFAVNAALAPYLASER